MSKSCKSFTFGQSGLIREAKVQPNGPVSPSKVEFRIGAPIKTVAIVEQELVFQAPEKFWATKTDSIIRLEPTESKRNKQKDDA